MRLYFTFFTILTLLELKAQSAFNTELIYKIEHASANEKINVLVLTKPNTEINFSEFSDIQFNYQAGNITSISGTISSIKQLSTLKNIARIEYTQHHLQLMSDTAHIRNRIKNIKTGLSPLAQPYDGNGVIVGVIDSGTDFNHPDFKDANGNSRIKYLWDMTKPLAVNTPTPFGYGQEWNNTQIDLGLCTHSDVAQFGHGTNSTGIAAGNGFSINKYEGMAPKSDIIIVAMDFNRPGFTISDALQYIITKSQLLNKPLVVNASLGDYYGSHDGYDLETQIINNLVSNVPGRALVAACGNAGRVKFHIGYNVLNTDTNFTWIKNSSNTITFSEYADTAQIKNVMYRIGVTHPSFSDVGATSFKSYNYALNTVKRDTIYRNSNRIGIIESIASINSFGVYELAVSINADSLNYLWSMAHTGIGRIDSWNFDYVTNNLPSVSIYPNIAKYKIADTLQTIVSGFQCSDEVIAVGNYIDRNKYIDVNGNAQTKAETPGQLHESSSTGPTRDNRIKPDIAATGANIMAALPLSLLATYIASSSTVVAQGGYHRTAGGTSAASPVVAGLAALYFQRNPTATNQQLKQAIINCAYSDFYTGANLPSNRWGYGKLDGFATMTCGEVLDNIKILSNTEIIQVFPNPLSSETNLIFPNSESKKIKLYNSSGQMVMEDSCESINYSLKRNYLASGLYFILVEEKNVSYKIKIVIL
jgi:subtilisin family serine protease